MYRLQGSGGVCDHCAHKAGRPLLPVSARARGAVRGRNDVGRALVVLQGAVCAARARALRHAEGAAPANGSAAWKSLYLLGNDACFTPRLTI